MGVKIFYFTGTGNCLMVSRDLANEMENTKIVSIAKVIDESEIDVSEECIGFVFPLYYGGIPPIVQDFIKKLPLDDSKYVFGIVTSWQFAGNSLRFLSKLLSEKGVKLAAGFHILLPFNFTANPDGIGNPIDLQQKKLFKPEKLFDFFSIVGVTPMSSQQKLFKQEKLKIKKIAEIIKTRKQTMEEPFILLRLTAYRPSFVKARKISSLNEAAKNFWIENHCKSCGICKSACPFNNVEIVNDKPKWGENCQQCMACINWCPERAIQSGDKTLNLKRYTNPTVTVKDIIDSARKQS